MSKFKPPQPEESVPVNVVPLVDIMFLLLLFLMVGGDMSHRESTELELPTADKAQDAERDVGEGERYVVINIHSLRDAASDAEKLTQEFRDPSNWSFAIGGRDFPDFFALVEELSVVGQQKTEDVPVPGTNPPRYLSAVKVSIRADKASPYRMIQHAMQACAAATPNPLYKIEVGAAKPATAN